MDNFWTWLKKANARAVFLCLLVVLLGVTVKWVWRLMSPIQMIHAAPVGTGVDPTSRALGLLAFMKAQRAAGSDRAANLFFTPDSLSQATAPAEPAEPVKPPDTVKNAKPPRPVKKTFTLTYRGLYTREDGTPMALIEDSRSKRSAFYAAGTNCFGFTLKSVAPETLNATANDGTDTALKRGVPQTFMESRHAD